jgi:hypothetical protein
VEDDGELLVRHAHLRAASRAPLLDHHAALLADLGRVERQTVRPVLEDVERLVDDRRRIGGDLEHVHRLVERGVRVQVRPEPHPRPLEEVDQIGLREAARPVERHVLHEVRDAELAVVLEDRAGVDHQPELRPLLGKRVAAHEIPKPVRQTAAQHGAVEGQGRISGLRAGPGCERGTSEDERDEE